MAIKIGTCGYRRFNPPDGWKNRYESKLQAYSHAFAVVELNRTFYQLPMVKTARRWREEVTENFEFTLKAWQAITHTTDSPTWRRREADLSARQKQNFGRFRPHPVVIDAWEKTYKRAEALGADICVLQCPASFRPSPSNESNMRQFFERIGPNRLHLAWEPRGAWNNAVDKVRALCRTLNLIHVVDLMPDTPVSDHPVAYIRLHGRNHSTSNLNYDYSDDELAYLAGRLKALAAKHEVVYCMFNNTAMFANAARLRAML